MLADAHIVDGGGQGREADVHRNPLPWRILRHAAHDADDPGVVALKNCFDMGDADVTAATALSRNQVEGTVAQDVLAWGVVLGPTVLQNAVGIIGGYSNHLAAGGLQCIQQSIALLRRLVHGVHDKIHDLIDIIDIIADGPHHLADRLRTAGAGPLHDSLTVAAQKCGGR